MISLCGAIIKQPSMMPRQEKRRQAEPKHAEQGLAKSMECDQHVDITINGKSARGVGRHRCRDQDGSNEIGVAL